MPVDTPSVAPVAQITLGGETRTLKYGFRAYKELGINPFDPESVKTFQERPPTIDTVSETIRAGLLHEYVKGGARAAEKPPSVEELVDLLDMPTFAGIWADMLKAMGADAPEKTDGESKPEGSANPLMA